MIDLQALAEAAWVVVFGGFFETSSRLHLAFIALAMAIAYGVYLARGAAGGFWRFAAPKEVYAHPSHITDIKLFFFGRLFNAAETGLYITTLTVAAALAMAMLGALTGRGGAVGGDWGWPAFAALTLALMAITDFCVYWVHRWHHERPALWPFHAVHHSAEVLTPVTVYRKHPVYELISALVRGAAIGLAQGVLLFAFVGKIDVLLIGGANAATVLFNLLGANLRHSHIWIDFGPVLGRIFISPAQHQIHHSIAPEHRDKNFGEVFALWDWMFGTLYLPRKQEALQFGLSDEHGVRLAQPHPDLRSALITPFKESAAALSSRPPRAPKQANA